MITNEVSGVVPSATTLLTSQGFGDCVYTSLFSPLTRTMRAVEVYGSQATVSWRRVYTFPPPLTVALGPYGTTPVHC